MLSRGAARTWKQIRNGLQGKHTGRQLHFQELRNPVGNIYVILKVKFLNYG